MKDAEGALSFEKLLHGRRIFVTGHTGFTGSWASLWLSAIGAEVHGFSLPPPTTPALFDDAGVEACLASHRIGDICDGAGLAQAVDAVRPDAILHLAAQPLVRLSYAEPAQTYAANLMGTVNLLEAARRANVAGVVCITTDKVYENREWLYGYREGDRLGGKDPYSASKACAEIAINSYRASMPSWGQKMLIAAARGGNIIGGGDWATDRLIPDFARAALAGEPITLRNPGATRPWQHVLCLVHGYLELLGRVVAGEQFVSDAWNLGPLPAEASTVGEVVERLRARWSAIDLRYEQASLAESTYLALDRTKAERLLGWRPAWTTAQGIDRTADWYAGYQQDPAQSGTLTRAQIEDYRRDLAGS